MNVSALQRALASVDCEVRFDNLTRQLYATDASIYQIEPLGVAFPRGAIQTRAVILAAAESGVPVIPRGAGTGLAGGALGQGLVLDLARFNRWISDLDLDRRTVRVGAGVVLDSLNRFLKPHGLCFGPDVATSARATLGGMIANNSSGARALVYGTTADHVEAIELVLADGRIETVGRNRPGLAREAELVSQLVRQYAEQIVARMPPGLKKRWPGYGLDRWLRAPGNLADIIAGSEGTLAVIVSAELRLVPLPRQVGLGLVFFDSVIEALRASVELLELKPAAIEHVDRAVFDQTRGQRAFQAARDLLELDRQPCEAFLMVEFYGEVVDRLSRLAQKRLGLRTKLLTDPAQMQLVWDLRKAGLALLTGCKGSAKPVTAIEDTAVRPDRLAEYVEALQELFKRLGLQASFYGHAGAGLLHLRPVLDLHQAADIKKLRAVAEEISNLVRQFQGSLAAEHGVGMARTEFLGQHLGPELLEALRRIKTAFDPRGLLNPGKILDDGRYKLDTHLRWGAGYALRLPFEPVLAFAAKDGSFIANLEQCNGCGGCRKETPTMCPTFIATGEESMCTRGRANLIRAVLEGRGLDGADPLRAAELEVALQACLACKACATECPSNVNMALLKAELLHARYRRDSLPFRAWLVSHVDLLGRVGCLVPGLANAALQWRSVRMLLDRLVGISARRPLPRFARQRFDQWFNRRRSSPAGQRGRVILWDDTFTRYHEPHIGQAAVAVLEAAGFQVLLPHGRQCCGRPAFSQGNLTEAARLARHNLKLLTSRPDLAEAPVLFLEPSCWSMFVEDYRELGLPEAEKVACRCWLFEQFLEELLAREPTALSFRAEAGRVAIHAHCHTKALLDPKCLVRLASRLPGRSVRLLDTGCCGMAGAFGAMTHTYELSVQVGRLMQEQISALEPDTVLVASGTSCRQQILHLCQRQPLHMAQLLAEALNHRPAH